MSTLEHRRHLPATSTRSVKSPAGSQLKDYNGGSGNDGPPRSPTRIPVLGRSQRKPTRMHTKLSSLIEVCIVWFASVKICMPISQALSKTMKPLLNYLVGTLFIYLLI